MYTYIAHSSFSFLIELYKAWKKEKKKTNSIKHILRSQIFLFWICNAASGFRQWLAQLWRAALVTSYQQISLTFFKLKGTTKTFTK